jgi:hypothetical protein
MIYYAQIKETLKPLGVHIYHPPKWVFFHAILDVSDLVMDRFGNLKAPGGDFISLKN